jgi:O-antigen/teichoic acid export membrane protein
LTPADEPVPESDSARGNSAGGLARRAIWISLGAALGQGLVLLSSLWLARIYKPAAFGELALLMSITNIASALACLRYDIMVPAASDKEVRGLVTTAIISCVGIGALVALVGALGPHLGQFDLLVRRPLLCGAAVTLSGLFSLSTSWLLRRGAYVGVGIIRASPGLIFAPLALAPGVGLLWAHAASFLPGLLALAALVGPRVAGQLDWRQAARINVKAPLMSLPGAALDVVGYSLLVWVIIGVYGQATAGEYSQAQRLIGAPLMLLSVSSAQVLLRQTAELRDNQKALDSLMLKVLGSFLGLSVLMLLGTGFLAERLFHILLGPRWHITTSMALAVACAVSIRASVSPMSSILVLWRRFGVALAWQGFYFASAATLFPLMANHFGFDVFVWFYALHETLQYSLYFALIWRTRRNKVAA